MKDLVGEKKSASERGRLEQLVVKCTREGGKYGRMIKRWHNI